MHGRHRDQHREEVVNECVEGFVREHAPRQVGHRLESIVDEQLWCHHHETEEIDSVRQRRDEPAVPAAVTIY